MSPHAWTTNPLPKSNSEIDMTTSPLTHRAPKAARWGSRATPKEQRATRRLMRPSSIWRNGGQVASHWTKWGYRSPMKISIRIRRRQMLSWASATISSISSSSKSTTVKSAAGSTLGCSCWVSGSSWSRFSMGSRSPSHPCSSCSNSSSTCSSASTSPAASNLLAVKSTSEIPQVARFAAGIFLMRLWWRSAMESLPFHFSRKQGQSRALKRPVKKVLLSCGASGRRLEWFWSPKSKD